MALRAEYPAAEEDDLLARYLEARAFRRPEDGEMEGIRTCAHCGERARFRVDPDGTWGVCSRCGRYA